MKRILAVATGIALVSGIAISETPDSRDSLFINSDFRDNPGEARAFWTYSFGHKEKVVNGLRYGLRYDVERAYYSDYWRAPMLELVHNVSDPFMPFEMNLSGFNVLDKNYMLNADGGVSWGTIATAAGLAVATGIAVSSSDDGDDAPEREDPPSTANGGDDALDLTDLVDLTDAVDLTDVVDLTDLLTVNGAWYERSGGFGYVPSEPLAPHEVEQLRNAAKAK